MMQITSSGSSLVVPSRSLLLTALQRSVLYWGEGAMLKHKLEMWFSAVAALSVHLLSDMHV